MAACEICGKRVRKDSLYSNTRDDGKRKNKGECSDCARELGDILKRALLPCEGLKEEEAPNCYKCKKENHSDWLKCTHVEYMDR